MKTPTITSANTAIVLSLAVLSATLVTPAFATAFYGTATGHWAGSYSSPRPQDLLGSRYYPAESQRQQEEGKVALKVWLAEDGTMSDAVVESSSGSSRLDRAAVRYMQENCHYKPAAGQPMPEFIRTVVKFSLD